MEILQDYKRNLRKLTISERNGRIGAVMLLFMVLQSAILINYITYLIFKWEDIEDRFVVLKAMVFWTVGFGFSVFSLCFFFDDFTSMTDATLKRTHFRVPYKISPQRQEIISTLDKYMKRLNFGWRILMLSYSILAVLFPVILIGVNYFLFSMSYENLIKQNYAVPFPFYFPEYFAKFRNYESLLNTIWYGIGYAVESLYTLLCYYVGRLTYTITLCSILNVEFEFKLLTQSITEMDHLIDQTKQLNYSNKQSSDVALKYFLTYFVEHLQNTYRKFDTNMKGIRWVALTLCNTTTLYLCLSIYTIVQTDKILKKVHETGFLVCWVNILYMYSYLGERLKTEVENFRNALYQSAWLDKPQWFKRSLLIVMARIDRPMEIKPFGLYGFDFNKFAMAVNAVYCYYNVLCNFKNMNQER